MLQRTDVERRNEAPAVACVLHAGNNAESERLDLNTIESLVEQPGRIAIGEWRPGDAWLAGGTWLFSEPQPHLARLLDLHGFGWPAMEQDDFGLTIAATCRIADLERWTPPPAWTAAALVPLCCRALLGSFKIWNSATVGGNVCLALPAGPMTSLTAALEGSCRIWGAERDRDVPIEEFITGAGRNALAPGELLRSIRFPAEALARRAAFRQVSLTPLGRSGALLIGTRGLDGSLRLTVTAATVRPVVLAYPTLPDRESLATAIAAIPEFLMFDDVHGRRDWRRAVTAHLAAEILDELRGA